MSVKEMYPSKSSYLKAEDLHGRTVKVKIASVSVAEFENGHKLTLGFEGKDKKLTLNKTNASVLADRFGDDEHQWPGNEIEIYPDKTTFQGNLVDCIRVRVSAPAAGPDDEIPF